ncbi:MAG: hypothetical protein PHY29_11415 [Syntrophales bacterium]|jgi:hypothetical protein|nr:hypothetical protein [Syntrophales bacterium]
MMRKYSILLLMLPLICCMSASLGEAAVANSFSPVWRVGDHWTVKAVYRSYPDQGKWSEPVFWRYDIVERAQEGGMEYLIMEVRDREDRLKVSSRLVYRAEDLSLVRVEASKTRRGKEFVTVLACGGAAPVATEQTLTPYDTPVFPLICPSSLDFSVTKHVDQLKAVRTVRQEVRQVSGVEEMPGLSPGGDLIEVICTGKDELVFTQYWDTALPWPVYGENGNMKYWLVRE